MAKRMIYKENDVVFGKDNTITLYVNGLTYKHLEQIGKQYYKDKRNRDGLIRAFAMVKLHQAIAIVNDFVPIRSGLFANGVSKRNYTDFLTVLEQENLIQIDVAQIKIYNNKWGKNGIIQLPNSYRRIEFCFDLFGKQKDVYPVKLSLKKELFDSLKDKFDTIRKYYKEDGLEEKRISIMLYNNNELSLVKNLVASIKKHSKRQLTSLNNIIFNSTSKLDNNSYLLDLIKEVIKRLERKDNKEQLVRSNLKKVVDNKHNTKFDYYHELRFDIGALDECMCLKDLRDLASLNTIPEYGKDDKLYSVFSRVRRPIRKYITFRGEHLVEVSDISCAHFTMLPKIFREYGITISPWWEMEDWVYLTQQGDLYSEVVKNTNIPRNAIKSTFQSFFSIKNENSYIYGGREKDYSNRRILCRWFKRNYPNIYKALLDWHNHQKIKIKRAANKVESEIMNPICDDLRALGLHPFRLHDAIYLPENEVEYIPFDIKQRVYNYINTKTRSMLKSA